MKTQMLLSFFCIRRLIVSGILVMGGFLGGCGYRFDQGKISASGCQTLSIPFVEGDIDGSLTAAIIKEVTYSGGFEYKSEGGSLILKVIPMGISENNIGFRYDRKKRGQLTREIIPVETRLVASVEVSILEVASNSIVLGPVVLSASVDFDHDYYSSRDGVNIFSLGQLSDIDSAYDAALRPLNQAMGKKIADYITQSW